MEEFDIAVIGSGPGGYIAAIRSAQLGYKTVLIEKYSSLGGTCTNVGCIPTKALLDSTHHYQDAKEQFDAHGIVVPSVQLNFAKMYQRKSDVVAKTRQGLTYLMDKNKITCLEGTATFTDNKVIQVQQTTGQITTLKAANYIIATGSKPATIPGVVIDKKRIITSTEALDLKEQPKSIIIIGGGVIGVEMATIFQRIGTSVTLIEYADRLLHTMDLDLGKGVHKLLRKQGIDIRLQHAVYQTESTSSQGIVHFKDNRGENQTLEADYVLVAVGRKPYTANLGLENTDIALTLRGEIQVNAELQTAVPHIYAIGDVIGGAMLAHKAEEEALFVVERINGQKPHINYNAIPSVVYTWPEVASVGLTEQELQARGTTYTTGQFPFSANARARAGMDTTGFAKVLTDPKYGEVLGVHIMGARAADLIAQAVVGLEYEVTANELANISYAHPTYSEVLKEAYIIASGRPAMNS